MVWIPGGEFSMGCFAPSEGLCTRATLNALNDAQPVHRIYVDGFWMDKTDVTNEEFAQFVAATGYKTVAEIAPTKEQFPTATPENLVAGSIVFTPPAQPVPLDDYSQWWRYLPGANWRHPTGPDSDLKGKEKYPAVQVCYTDAAAHAQWAGKAPADRGRMGIRHSAASSHPDEGCGQRGQRGGQYKWRFPSVLYFYPDLALLTA